jgi:hypothetical protein
MVVPELQRRELFRTAYDGPTLRDRLGLDRLASRRDVDSAARVGAGSSA